MFCGECGAKNEKGSLFCEECGAKLREVPKKEEKKESKKKATSKKKSTIKMTKKKKILIVVVAVAVIGLFIGYKTLEKKTSPETLVKNYLTAINNQDYNTLYELIKSDADSPFISKEAYIEALKKMITEKNMLGTISIGTTTYENAGLNASVSFNSSEIETNKISSILTGEDSLSIKLTKSKGKQYLFFDNWTIDDDTLLSFDTVKNYYIVVPQNTKVTYGTVSVADKYVDESKNSDDDNNTYYKLPEVLKTETEVKFELPDGLKVTKEITPSSYSTTYKLSLSKSDFTEKQQDTLLEQAKKDYETLMTGLLAKKEFQEIKGNFATKVGLDELEEEYNDMLEDLSESSYTISNYKISNARINSISNGNEYLYAVRVYISYTYDRQYKDSSSSSSRNRSGTYSLYYTYEDGYKLANVSGLQTF